MFDQLDCFIPGLLAHPDFQRGWEYGGEWFDDEYSDRPMTEAMIRQFLEGIFSERAHKGNSRFAHACAISPLHRRFCCLLAG
jgi:hypothetical protein